MSTKTLTIQEFLEARYRETEVDAIAAGGDRWVLDGGIHRESHPSDEVVDWAYGETDRHIARNDPAMVLADLAAKRSVLWFVKRVRASSEATDGRAPHWHTEEAEALGHVLVLLASAYRDHPDFNQEWL